MQILVFGAGKFYQRYKKYLVGHEIIGILDNNPALHGTYVDGHMVIPPEQVVLYDYDRIYILSYYMQDMFAQLNKLGIPKEKIFFTFDLLDLVIMPEIKICQANANRTGKKILCISHEFSITGAPNCLFYAVKCMKDKGYSITVASPKDGPMRKKFINLGVDVIVDERLLFSCGKTVDYLNTCDLLFINTAEIYYLLSHIKHDVPIIWWVHELLRMYQCVIPWRLPKNLKGHLSVYAVSSIAGDAFSKKFPDIMTELLPFGIIDIGVRKIRSSCDDKMVFVIIGSVGKEKGHDILFKALRMLPQIYINNLEVWCIGADETEMGSQLKQDAVEYDLPVIFKGVLDNVEVMHSLDEADVLICSSRGETMSMAVAEAMMKSVPAILPDKIGIADFINNKENGYLFAQDDSSSLSECMKYCMENRKKIIEVGKLARKTYEKYFSMEVFNAKLYRIIQEKLH